MLVLLHRARDSKLHFFQEDQMSQFLQNSTDFSVECKHQKGLCIVVKDNFIFLNNGIEHDAVNSLLWKCGNVVIIPDTLSKGASLLYHTSCLRMTDAVTHIFHDCLKAPVSLPETYMEMTLGEIHRRCVTIPYDDCRARVENYSFQSTKY